MSDLNNNLNITNLLYHSKSKFTSIIFAYLNITNKSFRANEETKQEKILEKYVKDLKVKMSKIISDNSEKNNKIKTKILKFDKNILDKITSDDYEFEDDFIFFIEHILEPKYKVILFENDNFSSYKTSSVFNKAIILYKNESKFYSVFSKDDTYIFEIDDPTIKLILSFVEEKEVLSEVYDISLTITKDKSLDMFILEENDVIFEDFNDDLIVHYTNKSFIPKFSKEEQMMQIQNLLTTNRKYKQSSKHLFDLIHHSLPTKTLEYNYNFIKTTNVNKNFEDYEIYLDEFSKYKKKFNNSYVKSIYYQDEDINANVKHVIVDNEDVIRNSFTNSINKLNNDIIINDVDSCKQHYTKQDLENISKKHKLNIMMGSKDKMCKQLLSINLLEKDIYEYYKKTYTPKELKKILGDVHQGPNTMDALIKTLIHTNKVELDKIFTQSALQDIAKMHDVSIDENNIYESLMNVNFLKTKKASEYTCDENDISIDAFDTYPNNNTYHLEMFRPIPQDKISMNGFYYNGDRSTTSFEIFNIANHLNILKSIHKYLPINCELHYFDGSIQKGKLQNVLQDNQILKINLESKQFVYYNLKNINDNKYYIYTDLHDGYKYNKHHINKNIYFEIEEYNYEEMKQFVSLNLHDYLMLFKPIVTNFHEIKRILKYFDASLFDMNKHDTDKMLDYLSKTANKSKNISTDDANKKEEEANITKKSIHKFLQFSEENQSDLHKMALLQSMNYIEHIHKIYANVYLQDHNQLDVQISFTKNTDNFKEVVQQYMFNSFQELQMYKKDITSNIDTNIDIELTIRKEESDMYVKNLDDILKKYDILSKDITVFMNTKHDKIFTEEMHYINKVSNIEGSLSPFNEFIQSDPTIVHDAIEQQNEDTSNDVFSNISQLVGIDITASEIKYIERQTTNTYIPLLYKYYKTQKKKDLNKNDFELWKHFTTMVIYSSFVTLISQYKYKIKNIFSKCSDIFSLHGFPLDTDKNKSFTAYMACVMFTLFNKQNKYFQSEKHIQSQIEAVIRLIFQMNPLFKQKFENLVHDTTNDVKLTNITMKPDLNSTFVKNLKITSSKTLLDRNMKLHNMTKYSIDMLLDHHNIMDIVCEKNMKQYTFVDFKFNNMKRITLPEQTILRTSKTNDNSDKIVLNFIEDFTKYFDLNFDQFRKTILLQSNDNHASIININMLFNKLINVNAFFEKQYMVFMDNLMRNSFNLLENIRSMFETIERTLMKLFVTDNIYTFFKVSIDAAQRTHLNTFMRYFQEHINNIIKKIEVNNIDIEHLKSKSEILREEEKQQKLGKYNNLQDDEMFIIMELEKQIGIKVDIANEEDAVVNEEEIEYQKVLSQDDDEPE